MDFENIYENVANGKVKPNLEIKFLDSFSKKSDNDLKYLLYLFSNIKEYSTWSLISDKYFKEVLLLKKSLSVELKEELAKSLFAEWLSGKQRMSLAWKLFIASIFASPNLIEKIKKYLDEVFFKIEEELDIKKCYEIYRGDWKEYFYDNYMYYRYGFYDEFEDDRYKFQDNEIYPHELISVVGYIISGLGFNSAKEITVPIIRELNEKSNIREITGECTIHLSK